MTPPKDTWALALERLARCRKRCHTLRVARDELRVSRDEWKRKAQERQREIVNLRAQVARAKARAPEWRRPPRHRRTVTIEQLREHDRIVKRILAIPVREI